MVLKFCLLKKNSFSSQRGISKQAKQKGKERGITSPRSRRPVPQHAMRKFFLELRMPIYPVVV